VSEALAATATVPDTVAPFAGAVTETVGAVVSTMIAFAEARVAAGVKFTMVFPAASRIVPAILFVVRSEVVSPA
jgi:hypothetical protein